MRSENNLFTIVACLFVTTLLISNIAAQKLIPVGPFVFTGGIILFPFTYIFGDILTEVWGYKKSRVIIYTGFLASLIMMTILYIVVKMPAAPGWPFQHEFETTLGFVPRIVLGSLAAYLCGEFLNSYVVAKLKLKDNGKKMGWRFVLSTVFGEGIDTVIFAMVALYGVVPNDILFTAMWSGYLFKVAYEIIALPFTIPLVSWLKRKTNSDVYDRDTNFNPLVLNN